MSDLLFIKIKSFIFFFQAEPVVESSLAGRKYFRSRDFSELKVGQETVTFTFYRPKM